jgi:hypothetical protein
MSLKNYGDEWSVTEKATSTCHWKGYPDVQLKRLIWHVTKKLRWWVTGHWECYPDVSLKRLHRVLLEPPVARSLYKYMSSYNASSHFTHILSIPSRTTLVNMPRYLIPAWNECPFYRCSQRAKLTTSLELSTYGRRYWVCLDTDPTGVVGFSISIS